MSKPFDVNHFLKLTPEQQAKAIEQETQRLLAKLPSLKKNLQMYNEVSDEMYNLSSEEIEQQGLIYARAVRKGEITTPTGQQAYKRYLQNLHKYTRRNMGDIMRETAEMRIETWLQTLKDHASQEEIDYAERLLNQMTPEQKLGFTRSRYFIDNSNWNSKEKFVKDTEDGEYSMQTLELELYLQANTDIETDNIYNSEVATDGNLTKKRRGIRKARKRKKG